METTLGKRIKALRKELHISQAELAKKIGMSASAIGMYEQNRRIPDNETLLKFSKYFGVSTDYLLGKSDYAPNDVSNILEDFTNMLSEQEGLMFDGVPLTEDEKQQVLNAIMQVAKIADKITFNENGGNL